MNDIIEQLYKLIELLKQTNTDKVASGDVNKAVADVESIISLLQFDDLDALGRLTYIFHPEVEIYKIANAGGWTNELRAIEKEIYPIVGAIRIEQKRYLNQYGKIKPGNGNSYATNPGMLTISNKKWKAIAKAYHLNLDKRIKMAFNSAEVQRRLFCGDTQPAIVMCLAPLLVAAYSTDMDAVVLLAFPAELAKKNNLKLYDRLITINGYDDRGSVNEDIFIGKHYQAWTNFAPIIGDLVSDDNEQLAKHKSYIPEALWQYVRDLGERYLWKYSDLARWGFWFVP